MNRKDIQRIAEDHGLSLTDRMTFNDMGIDFKVGFAQDAHDRQWVLRLPRRDDLKEQIENEQRILQLAKKYLTIEVPDWRIASENLVAYPLLENEPALTFDSETHEVSWHMDQQSAIYPCSLASALVDLHAIPESEVRTQNLKILKPEDLRQEIMRRLQLVKSELGISQSLENQYRRWLDNDPLWPDFTRFVHGDLYAGHVLVDRQGTVSGIIDWSTAHVGDIALDFSSHYSIFGEESVKDLINEYEKLGGRVWDTLLEQVVERAGAAPLAYGFFAVETGIDVHIAGAKAQLGAL